MKVDCKSCSRSINTSSKTVERFQTMSTRPFKFLAGMESCKTLTGERRGMKRKADNDFQSVSGEGKPYALRKRIKLSEMENTRDTEMTSYEEKTSSGGRGEKRKADDDFQRVSGGGKSYALRKRIKVSEMENTRDTEMTSFQEKTSSGGRGEKRKADDAFQSVSGGGKPSAHRKRIKVTELENTREDADTEASSSGGRGVKVMIEIKDVLSVAVGPRSDDEVFTVRQIESVLDRVGQTLGCRKRLSPVVEQMLLRCTVQLACKLVSGELPLVSSAEGNKRPDLLERFLVLWSWTPAPPLHLLLTEPTLTAIFTATDRERTDYLFLIRQLIERGLLGEQEVGTNWAKLSALSWPEESVEKFQQLSLATQFSMPQLPNHRDLLQVSQ